MKGKLEKIGDKWFVRYVRYEGGGSFRLPLHPNFVEMTEFVYIKNIRHYDGDEIDFTEALVNPMGRDVDSNNLGQNHSLCKWYARPYLDEKEEQKQHLIDMMNSDEELGLYDEPGVKEIKEVKLEDVFNDEKREGVKKLIELHKKYEHTYTNKEIRTWWLNQTEERRRNMVREYFKGGNSENINTLYGIMPEEMEEMYNINVDVVIMDWEEILFDFIDFYPCQLPDELFEWLKENYEIPKKKDGERKMS